MNKVSNMLNYSGLNNREKNLINVINNQKEQFLSKSEMFGVFDHLGYNFSSSLVYNAQDDTLVFNYDIDTHDVGKVQLSTDWLGVCQKYEEDPKILHHLGLFVKTRYRGNHLSKLQESWTHHGLDVKHFYLMFYGHGLPMVSIDEYTSGPINATRVNVVRDDLFFSKFVTRPTLTPFDYNKPFIVVNGQLMNCGTDDQNQAIVAIGHKSYYMPTYKVLTLPKVNCAQLGDSYIYYNASKNEFSSITLIGDKFYNWWENNSEDFLDYCKIILAGFMIWFVLVVVSTFTGMLIMVVATWFMWGQWMALARKRLTQFQTIVIVGAIVVTCGIIGKYFMNKYMSKVIPTQHGNNNDKSFLLIKLLELTTNLSGNKKAKQVSLVVGIVYTLSKLMNDDELLGYVNDQIIVVQDHFRNNNYVETSVNFVKKHKVIMLLLALVVTFITAYYVWCRNHAEEVANSVQEHVVELHGKYKKFSREKRHAEHEYDMYDDDDTGVKSSAVRKHLQNVRDTVKSRAPGVTQTDDFQDMLGYTGLKSMSAEEWNHWKSKTVKKAVDIDGLLQYGSFKLISKKHQGNFVVDKTNLTKYKNTLGRLYQAATRGKDMTALIVKDGEEMLVSVTVPDESVQRLADMLNEPHGLRIMKPINFTYKTNPKAFEDLGQQLAESLTLAEKQKNYDEAKKRIFHGSFGLDNIRAYAVSVDASMTGFGVYTKGLLITNAHLVKSLDVGDSLEINGNKAVIKEIKRWSQDVVNIKTNIPPCAKSVTNFSDVKDRATITCLAVVVRNNALTLLTGDCYVFNGYIYYRNMPFTYGDSGTPIFDIEGKLLGIHVGAFSSQLYGVHHTKFFEEHDYLITTVNMQQHGLAYPDLGPDKKSYGFKDWHEISDYVNFGLSDDKNFGVAKPNKHTILKDVIKYFRPLEEKPKFDMLALAVDKVNSFFPLNKSKVLSFDEAVKLVDRAKSPGYPWTNKYKTKGEVIDNHLEWLREFVHLVQLGNPLEVTWAVCGKMEIRDLERILDHKVRTFLIAPIEHNILTIMYFHDLDTNYFGQPLSAKHSTIGESPFYGGWDELGIQLEKYKYVDGTDVSKFDSSQTVGFRSVVYEMRCDHIEYTMADIQALEWIFWSSTISKIRLPDGQFFVTPRGQKSGDGVTLSFNTHLELVLTYYCLFCYLNDKQLSFDLVDEYFIVCHGDDNLYATNERIAPEILAFYAKDLGFEVTSDSTGNMKDVTYIGFKFLKIDLEGDRYWLPIYDLSKSKFSLKVSKSKQMWKYLTKVHAIVTLTFPHVFVSEEWLQQWLVHVRYYESLLLNYNKDPMVREATKGLLKPSEMLVMYLPEFHGGRTINFNRNLQELILMQFKTHGNYCGPNYSAGRFTKEGEEVDWNVEGVDQLDKACKTHDQYYNKKEFLEGDKVFIKELESIPGVKAFVHRKTFEYIVPFLRRIGVLESDMTKTKSQKKRARLNRALQSEKKAVSKIVRRREKRMLKREEKKLGAYQLNHQPGVATSVPNVRQGIKSRKNVKSGNTVLKGTELIGQVTVNKALAGDILIEYSLAPQTIKGSTLAIESALYEKYFYKKLRLEYVSACSTSTSGQLITYIDYDPDTQPTSGGSMLAAAASAKSNMQHNVWRSLSVNQTLLQRQQAYYTNPSSDNERRFDTQGIVRVVAGTLMDYGTSTISLGNLYMHYEIEFQVRENNFSRLRTYHFMAIAYDAANKKFNIARQHGNLMVHHYPGATSTILAIQVPLAKTYSYLVGGTVTTGAAATNIVMTNSSNVTKLWGIAQSQYLAGQYTNTGSGVYELFIDMAQFTNNANIDLHIAPVFSNIQPTDETEEFKNEEVVVLRRELNYLQDKFNQLVIQSNSTYELLNKRLNEQESLFSNEKLSDFSLDSGN